MVRLFKLLSAFLDQTMQGRRETGEILGRLTFETIVHIRYLVKNFSPALVDSYVRRSLRHERELRDLIMSNISQRNGNVLPIETRMLNSITRAERIAGVSLDSIDLKDRRPWGDKNIYEKAKDVGLGGAYIAMFGGLSHNVHGSWHDIYQHHLEIDGDDESKFKPSLEWDRPRPQLLTSLGSITVETIHIAVEFLGGDEALRELDAKLIDLHDRLRNVDNAHETYLKSKTWPQI